MHLPLALPDDYAAFLDSLFAGREPELAAAVRRLSAAYVANRPPRRLSDDDRRAYAAYYGPGGALKVVAVLAELVQRGWRPPTDVLALADLGAGPGTATLGVVLANRLLHWEVRIEALLFDRDTAWNPSLLLEPFARDGDLRFTRVAAALGAEHGNAGGPFDLMIAANTLVEIDREVAELGGLLHAQTERALAAGGVLVILEPAMRDTTRRLHALRDDLLARGLRVVAPCLHQERCPMLARAGDWCHEVRPWEQPRYHQRLDHLVRLDKRRLQFSYLALSHGIVSKPAPERAARVVSTVLREKGRTRFRTCDATGRLLDWDLLRRTSGPVAELVVALDRGEELRLPHSCGGRLGPEDDLARFRPTASLASDPDER